MLVSRYLLGKSTHRGTEKSHDMQTHLMTLLRICVCFAIAALFIIQPAFAVNGTKITNVTAGTYSFDTKSGSSMCYDGTYYYVFWNNNGALTYAYSTSPTTLNSWSIVIVSSTHFVFSIYCGNIKQSIPNYVAYSIFTYTGTENVVYSTFTAGTVGQNITAFSNTGSGGAGTSFLQELGIIINTAGGVIIAEDFQQGNCNSGNLFAWVSGQPGMGLTTLQRNSQCTTIPFQLMNNNGVAYIVWNCTLDSLCQFANPIGSNNGLTAATTYSNGVWNSAISISTIPFGNGMSASFDRAGNIYFMGICGSQVGNPGLSCFNDIQDYYNTIATSGSTLSFGIGRIFGDAGTSNSIPNNYAKMVVKNQSAIPQVLYYSGQNIDYNYPFNETTASPHVLYSSGGDTINTFDVNLIIDQNNYYLPYFVSSTNPNQLKFAASFSQVAPQATVTIQFNNNKTVSDSLANQLAAFMAGLFPAIVIIVLLMYFAKKLGLSDTGMVLWFIIIVAFITFLGLLNIYIGVFVDMISGVGLLSETVIRSRTQE